MNFITKLDYSSNRQIKQFKDTTTQLSGSTLFGIDDSLIPINLVADTINIDALQNIRTVGLIFPKPLPFFTGTTYQLLGRDSVTGKVVEVSPVSGGTSGGTTTINTDDYTINASFNDIDNLLTFTRLSGGTYDVSLSALTGSNSGTTSGGTLQGLQSVLDTSDFAVSPNSNSNIIINLENGDLGYYENNFVGNSSASRFRLDFSGGNIQFEEGSNNKYLGIGANNKFYGRIDGSNASNILIEPANSQNFNFIFPNPIELPDTDRYIPISVNGVYANSDGEISIGGFTGSTSGTSSGDDYTTGVTFNDQILEFTRLSGGTYSADTTNTTWQDVSTIFGTSALVPTGQADSWSSDIAHNGTIVVSNLRLDLNGIITNRGFSGVQIYGNTDVIIESTNGNNGAITFGSGVGDVWNGSSEARKNTITLRRDYRAPSAPSDPRPFQLTGTYANDIINFDAITNVETYYASFESNPTIQGTELVAHPERIFALRGSGRIMVTDYGLGNVTTSAATNYMLGVDVTGRVVDIPIVTGGGSSSPFERIDEGNGEGIVISGRTAANFGNVGFRALDFSTSYGPSTTVGATGAESVNFGEDSITSGYGSFAGTGFLLNVTGTYGAAFGYDITNNGYSSFAIGSFLNTAGSTGYNFVGGNGGVNNGNACFAWGPSVIKGAGVGASVLGAANVDITSSNNGTDPLAPMLIVGNGTHSTPNGAIWVATARSNALEILRNGEITVPSTDIADINNAGDKSIITKEYLDSYKTQKVINLDYDIINEDDNNLLVLSGTSDFNITVNSGLTENFETEFINIGTSTITFVEGTGSLNNPDGTIMLPNKVAMLVHIGNTGEYWLKGELE